MWLNLSSKSKTFLSSKWNAILLLLFSYALFSLEFSPAFQGFGVDKEVFRYMGMLIANDGIPYLDAFDHKPPVIYLINYLGFIIYDAGGWGVFIINNLIGFLAALMLFKAASNITKSRSFAFFLTFGYIAFSNFFPFLDMGNMTRQLTMYFTVMLLSTYFLEIADKTKFLCIGVLSGLIFFTQQNEILASIPVVVYFFFNKSVDLKKVFLNLLFFGLGLVAISCGLFLILKSWANVEAFIDQAFLFNLNAYIPSEDNAVVRFANFIIAMFRPRMLPLLTLLLLAFGWTIYNYKSITKFQLVLIGALILQAFSGAMSGRHYPHYYMMLLPFIMYLFLVQSTPTILSNRWWPTVCLIVIFGYFLIKGIFMFKFSKSYPLHSEVHEIVKEKTGKRGQFYTFDKNHLGVNTDLEIIAPTRWIYTQFAYSNYDPQGEIFDEILKGFEIYKTTYILIPNYFKDQKVSNYINAHYAIKIEQPGFVLYERRK